MSRTDRSRPSRLPYVLGLFVLAAVVVAAWSGRSPEPAIAGIDAPDFEATTLRGDPTALGDYAGKVVLLNIWATGCAPCLQEMPSIQRLYERVDDPDFDIVAVSVDAAVEGERGYLNFVGGNVPQWVERLGLTFDVLRDPSGEVGEIYDVTGLPESFLIGRDGRIYRRLAGATEWDADAYVEQIERLLDT